MPALAVVSCVWQRPERLGWTLSRLGWQDVPFDLHLIVNNPAHGDLVERMAQTVQYPVITWHNATNRGPYARLEVMNSLAHEYEYFVTVDDDLDFDANLLRQWWAKRDPQAVQGWAGWRFVGNYWSRVRVGAGEDCHYLWGSNLFVPRAAVEDTTILGLPERFWQCDDLWLCYHANHVKGLTLRAQDISGVSIAVDGKDTYRSQLDTKIVLLNDLRDRG